MSGYERSEASKDQREIVGIFIGQAITRLEKNWRLVFPEWQKTQHSRNFAKAGFGIELIHKRDGRVKSFLKYVDSFGSLVSVGDVERAELKGKQ